jgi:hypothetical protein
VAKVVGIRPDVSVISPELEQSIARTMEAYERAIAQAEATDDPTAPLFRLLLLHLTASHGLYTEGAKAIRSAVEGRQPLDPQAMWLLLDRVARAATGALERHADALVSVVNRRTVGWLAAAGVAVLVCGAAIGWAGHAFYDPAAPMVTGCVPAPQPSGEALTCTFWVRPPRS